MRVLISLQHMLSSRSPRQHPAPDLDATAYTLILFFLFFFFCFFGPHLQHIDVPRLGVELELQLPATATATTTRDLSHICDLHHSSWQHQILNPEQRPRIEPATSWFLVRSISAAPQRELLGQVFVSQPLCRSSWESTIFMST